VSSITSELLPLTSILNLPIHSPAVGPILSSLTSGLLPLTSIVHIPSPPHVLVVGPILSSLTSELIPLTSIVHLPTNIPVVGPILSSITSELLPLASIVDLPTQSLAVGPILSSLTSELLQLTSIVHLPTHSPIVGPIITSLTSELLPLTSIIHLPTHSPVVGPILSSLTSEILPLTTIVHLPSPTHSPIVRPILSSLTSELLAITPIVHLPTHSPMVGPIISSITAKLLPPHTSIPSPPSPHSQTPGPLAGPKGYSSAGNIQPSPVQPSNPSSHASSNGDVTTSNGGSIEGEGGGGNGGGQNSNGSDSILDSGEPSNGGGGGNAGASGNNSGEQIKGGIEGNAAADGSSSGWIAEEGTTSHLEAVTGYNNAVATGLSSPGSQLPNSTDDIFAADGSNSVGFNPTLFPTDSNGNLPTGTNSNGSPAYPTVEPDNDHKPVHLSKALICGVAIMTLVIIGAIIFSFRRYNKVRRRQKMEQRRPQWFSDQLQSGTGSIRRPMGLEYLPQIQTPRRLGTSIGHSSLFDDLHDESETVASSPSMTEVSHNANSAPSSPTSPVATAWLTRAPRSTSPSFVTSVSTNRYSYPLTSIPEDSERFSDYNSGLEIVRRSFSPRNENELVVVPGDVVRIVERISDSWCSCEMVKRSGSVSRGLVPVACLRGPENTSPSSLEDQRSESSPHSHETISW
jgi:hypothetical protein